MHKRIYEDKSKLKRLDKSTQFIIAQSERYLLPFMHCLTLLMDKRLVATFRDVFIGILGHRDKDKCLILSELGGYITGFIKAPSGTKRLSNLFLSKRWTASHIEAVHVSRLQEHVKSLQDLGHSLLGFIDDSTIEKPESWKSEGLSAVYSSQAARLTRIKRGYYKQPKGRICVPGFEWTGLMIGGLGLLPMVGLMKFWTKRGVHMDSRDNVFYKLIKQIQACFGSALTLVLDRGYANITTLDVLIKHQQTFIIRWKSAILLKDNQGHIKNTWRICHGKKGFDRRVFADKERKMTVRLEIIYAPVWHPTYEAENNKQPFTLVVIRNKSIKGQQPMYLLTNQLVDSIGMAWAIFKSYIQRWDIEQAFRFNKAEIGIQSIRVHALETRLKILAVIMLIYDFLLQLRRNHTHVSNSIIKKWCPRTDNRLNTVRLPLYRLRLACANALLWIFVEMIKVS